MLHSWADNLCRSFCHSQYRYGCCHAIGDDAMVTHRFDRELLSSGWMDRQTDRHARIIWIFALSGEHSTWACTGQAGQWLEPFWLEWLLRRGSHDIVTVFVQTAQLVLNECFSSRDATAKLSVFCLFVSLSIYLTHSRTVAKRVKLSHRLVGYPGTGIILKEIRRPMYTVGWSRLARRTSDWWLILGRRQFSALAVFYLYACHAGGLASYPIREE